MGDREKASLRLQFNSQIRLELHGATITSDAGLLAFRELDDALDLTPIASDYLQESRTGRNIRHHLVPLLRQSIYSRLAGYDDTNDAERLSQDPAMRVVGLKTRLLDITRNPLVAFFHACSRSEDEAATAESKAASKKKNGRLHIFAVPKELVKPFDSGTISVIANFARLRVAEQNLLLGKKAEDVAPEEEIATADKYSKFIARIGQRLVEKFDYARAGTTPVTVGDAMEQPVRDQLEQILPRGIAVGEGFVIDSEGGTSKQTDVILYERDICPKFSINNTPGTTFYPCEGVIAVGEVKSTLDRRTLRDAFEKIASVKKLQRRATQNFMPHPTSGEPIVQRRNYGSLQTSPIVDITERPDLDGTAQIFGFVVAEELEGKAEIFCEAFNLDFPDRTEFPEHEALWDGANYKTAY